MPMSEASIKAHEKYRKKAIKRYLLTLHREYDKDIIDKLESLEQSKNSYLKELIRKDIAKKISE